MVKFCLIFLNHILKCEGGDAVRKLQSIINKLRNLQSNLVANSQLNLPRITIIGDIHIYIENHRGILRFTSQEVILKVTNGNIRINGSDLVIKMLLTEEILIEGKIDSIKINDKTLKTEWDDESR